MEPQHGDETLSPETEARVREHFAGIPFLATLGVRMDTLAPGLCEMSVAMRPELSQQHGYLHGGIIGTLADSASGHASLTLLPPEYGVITVEFKLNFLAPADGTHLRIRARIVRHGKRLSVCEAQAFSLAGAQSTQCATALVTYIVLPPSPE